MSARSAESWLCVTCCSAARGASRQLRIETELSDAETGTVMRSDLYEGDLAHLFELQRRITVSVVRTVAPHVRERELVRARRTPRRA
jgi:hypothetical protein